MFLRQNDRSKRTRGLLATLALAALLPACSNDGAPDTGDDDDDDTGAPLTCAEIDRTMTGEPVDPRLGDQTLSGVYAVEGRVIFDAGQTVTIEPGTIFLMGPDAKLWFGWRNDPATVFADGTAEAPILFCGTDDRKGHWEDLELLTGTTSDSRLAHVRLEDGGGNDVPTLLVTVDALLDSVAVVDGASDGFLLQGLREGSENLTSTGNDGAAGRLQGENAISNLPTGDYTGNGEDVLLVSAFSDTNVVFRDRGVPFRQTEDRVIFGPAGGDPTSITLEAGVTYQFCQDCFMLIGWRNDPGAIYARGTAEDPVVFTSSQETPAPGDWNGIELLGGTPRDSVIENAEIRFGGKADGANLLVNAGKGTIRSSLFADSLGYGILVERDDAGLTIADDNTFSNNALGDVQRP